MVLMPTCATLGLGRVAGVATWRGCGSSEVDPGNRDGVELTGHPDRGCPKPEIYDGIGHVMAENRIHPTG